MAKIIGKNIGDIPGTFKEYGGGSVPIYHLLCDGTAVNRITFKALFAAIGTTYGVGDGTTTFNLPDSRRRTHIGSGGSQISGPGTSVGSTGGEELHTLSSSEVVDHQHLTGFGPKNSHDEFDMLVDGSNNPVYGFQSSTGRIGRDVTGLSFFTGITVNEAKTSTMTNIGSASGHNNMQPSLVVTKIIKY